MLSRMSSNLNADLWIRNYHPGAAGSTQLVCLPHAGGSASFYFPVSQAMSPAVDVLAIQYPGRQDRRSEPSVQDLHVLARQIFTVLRPRTDRPMALFGHSMGASLAFEVARLLETEAGVVPRRLFASGRRAPSTHRDERVHLMDDQGVIDELRKLNGTGGGMLADDEMIRLILPAVRADYTAAETYRASSGGPLSCPITVFTGSDDPKVSLDEARAWQAHTTADFDFRAFPGGHFFLTQHQAGVLGVMKEQLTSGRPVPSAR